LLKGLVLAVVGLDECTYCGSVDFTLASELNLVFSVVAVLYFHLSVACHINKRIVVSLFLHVPLQTHVHVEGLVSLFLAVRKACFLSRCFRAHSLAIDTVEETLFEE
jgi:hypothetical protein